MFPTLYFVKPPDSPSPVAILSLFSNCNRQNINETKHTHSIIPLPYVRGCTGVTFCPIYEDISTHAITNYAEKNNVFIFLNSILMLFQNFQYIFMRFIPPAP